MIKIAAVLTGDLIASTKASPSATDRAMDALSTAARRLSYETEHDTLFTRETRFTRYRGDGWQIYLDAPNPVLRACLLLIASLRASDCGLSTRISAGMGTVTQLGRSGLSDASGDAFTISGHGLDGMPRSKRLIIHGSKRLMNWHTAIFDLADSQSRRWSREQAEAIALDLDPECPPTQAEMAERLGITRQALQARLSGAGRNFLSAALYAFESSGYPNEDFQ